MRLQKAERVAKKIFSIPIKIFFIINTRFLKVSVDFSNDRSSFI